MPGVTPGFMTSALLTAAALAPGPFMRSDLVFPPHDQHNHAAGIAACSNGDVLVSWYRGSGERKADDVAVYGARLRKGTEHWTGPAVWADTPRFPDGNTALFIDRDDRLWLFWPVVMANTWESCITKYRVSSEYHDTDPPKWQWQDIVPLAPQHLPAKLHRALDARMQSLTPEQKRDEQLMTRLQGFRKRFDDKLLNRLGWQPRCKPTQLPSGRILLPLYSDTYAASIMAVSDDDGKTWYASQPLIGMGNIQPTVLRRRNGTLVAYMRENGPLDRIRVCESTDDGITWGPVGVTNLPNPGAGLDGLVLSSGNWLLVYNDATDHRHSLAVSLSHDEGRTWLWTRHLEKHQTESYHYPAVTQGRDRTIHAVYSYFVPAGKSIKHAAFNEAWVMGDDD